ncbi:MAG: D-alanyl-D-alanine carboxypeptidase [Solirubrobacteraceae bacterium]|nr:D-alanyl-D-alanine carboxypeptidase [Solirubrobacteraceae bacterium]
MSDVDLGAVDRRTLLVGAAGALAAAGLSAPAHAASPATRSGLRFDPRLGHQLQQALRAGLRDPGTTAPGAILHVHSAKLGAWTGVAGLGRVMPDVPMRPADRFRAGSIAKPFVAVVVLQLAERGRLSLDARLPEVLPASVIGRFPTAPDVTVRMLLGHRSGIPEWTSDAFDVQIARDPARVWKVSELLDIAAAQPPVFSPGTGFFYSNTDYNLLGLIVERITGRSWRHEVTRRIVRPLRLTRTGLPAPGNRSIAGAHAHGYANFDGKTQDMTRVDPSIAGAAGGYALVSTVQDLARFIDALSRGRLFRHPATRHSMFDLAPAEDVGGLVGYGLGIERRALPGGAELVGHLGGTAGYRSYVGHVHPGGATMTFVMNANDDPTPLVLPAVQALTGARR